MASKNKFEIVNGNIHISRAEWKQVAEVTYREDYYDELKSAILGLEKEERIKVLAKALKLTKETATGLVDQFYEEDHYDLFDD